MLFTPIYIAMTFIKTWRIRSFRARLLEFLSGNTSVAFCKVPENAAETPTLSSKLCTNPKNAYLCDLLDYTNASRICSMKPTQCIDVCDWVTCTGGLPLGSNDISPVTDLDVEVLFECEMEPHEGSSHHDIISLESMGQPVAWKAGSHLAIVLKTNMEHLSMVGFHFIGGEFIIDHKLPVVRIQTVQLSGEPNKATDASMRGLRTDIQLGLKQTPEIFQWPVHAALLKKLSKVVDIKSDRSTTVEMNGGSDQLDTVPKKTVTLADVSTITTRSLSAEDEFDKSEPEKKTIEDDKDREVLLENVTVEIQHNITPKKSSLKLDLKKGTSQLSTSLLNISSQIKSITTHKRIVSTTGPRKTQETIPVVKEEVSKSPSQSIPKSLKSSRPLINTKSPNVLIYSDSVVARDNLEASLRKVLDCDRYTIYSVSREALEGGAWRGRAALVGVAGCAGRAAPLLLAHLLDGGRLLALCSDLLHAVLPYYKTAEVRESEIVQFSYDKWKSVKMKHHIFCYQASPAKKQFSTESDRQPSKYTGHPGHELDIQILASEETWRTPSLLQATDLVNNGVAIFSQIHLEADPNDYLGDEGFKSNEARLGIIHKILGDILGLHVKDPKEIRHVDYTMGYFLGNHVDKISLVNKWCSPDDEGRRIQKLDKLTIQWCMRGETPLEPPSAEFLPVCLYECPENFSTVEYFDNLTSTSLGRLVIYSEVIESTTLVVDGGSLSHGVACVARRQLAGRGRAGNAWLTPPGQAALSIQVWRKMSPRLSLVQHAAALAAVRAIRADTEYEQLDIRLKWPNDIYYGRDVKIGGIITKASCLGDDVIVQIGAGVNISNSIPTTCINDIISEHNRAAPALPPLAPLSVEKFLARWCSQLELVLEDIDTDEGLEVFFQQYYQYWLHDGEEIMLKREGEESPVAGVVCGVDECGWLRVRAAARELRVAPDGNTFDIMTGLIAPKI
ncbi:PREDICTED: biotin--protein ligase [Papilio polytes]|uniref:biotin--protein ligase n=1 Tax=Papilio polytes TaxID=76194 RepID=UPI000676510C|nr:PREDICTED: biotin--protein ligase [Papilio polytes]